MLELLYDLRRLAFSLGTIGLVAFWVWSARRTTRPRPRTDREQAELAGLLAAIDADQDRLLRSLPAVNGAEPPTR